MVAMVATQMWPERGWRIRPCLNQEPNRVHPIQVECRRIVEAGERGAFVCRRRLEPPDWEWLRRDVVRKRTEHPQGLVVFTYTQSLFCHAGNSG